jgi:hypothetical protein
MLIRVSALCNVLLTTLEEHSADAFWPPQLLEELRAVGTQAEHELAQFAAGRE